MLHTVGKRGLNARKMSSHHHEQRRLHQILKTIIYFYNSLKDDQELFLNDNVIKTISKYQAKYKTERSSTDKLKELNWDTVEFVDLLDSNSRHVCV